MTQTQQAKPHPGRPPKYCWNSGRKRAARNAQLSSSNSSRCSPTVIPSPTSRSRAGRKSPQARLFTRDPRTNQRGHQQATTTQADPQQPTRRNRFPSNRSRTGQARNQHTPPRTRGPASKPQTGPRPPTEQPQHRPSGRPAQPPRRRTGGSPRIEHRTEPTDHSPSGRPRRGQDQSAAHDPRAEHGHSQIASFNDRPERA